MAKGGTARERAGQKGEACEGGRPGQDLTMKGGHREHPGLCLQGSLANPMAYFGGAELMPVFASEACPQTLSLTGDGDEKGVLGPAWSEQSIWG